jgi:hypothetical protein
MHIQKHLLEKHAQENDLIAVLVQFKESVNIVLEVGEEGVLVHRHDSLFLRLESPPTYCITLMYSPLNDNDPPLRKLGPVPTAVEALRHTKPLTMQSLS